MPPAPLARAASRSGWGATAAGPAPRCWGRGILAAVTASAVTASTALTDAPILAHVVRSGIVESVHRGTVVVTAPDGSVERAWGAPAGLILPRSANKPLQAVGLLGAGLDLPPDQLALACSSHSGEPRHREVALAILAGAGLTEADLRNTPGLPIDPAAQSAWLRAGHDPSRLTQNCSGKHAAMLATAVAGGWSTESYLDPDHPVQQAITAAIARLTGQTVGALAVDGCGAPLHGYPIRGLARAFGALAVASAGSPEARVRDAIRAHPFLLGGTGRQVSALVREVPGAIAKDGAESVYAVGLPDGRGIAVKIADGHPRAKAVVLAAVLRHLGAGTDPAYAALEDEPVLGHGESVGAVLATGI